MQMDIHRELMRIINIISWASYYGRNVSNYNMSEQLRDALYDLTRVVQYLSTEVAKDAEPDKPEQQKSKD